MQNIAILSTRITKTQLFNNHSARRRRAAENAAMPEKE